MRCERLRGDSARGRGKGRERGVGSGYVATPFTIMAAIVVLLSSLLLLGLGLHYLLPPRPAAAWRMRNELFCCHA